MAEFVEIGYDLREITIGGEIPAAALRTYSEYLVEDMFPPKTTIDIRVVVDGGNANIPPKCGKKEAPPMRNAEPRKKETNPGSPPSRTGANGSSFYARRQPV